MLLEVVNGGGRGREEDKFLTFKLSNAGVHSLPLQGIDIERGGKNKGREEGGREEVGREGDNNSAECLPTKTDAVSFFPIMLAGYSIVNTHSCTLYIHMHTDDTHTHTHTHITHTHTHAHYTPTLHTCCKVYFWSSHLLLEKNQ